MTTARVAPAEYLAQNQPLQMLVVDDVGDMYILDQPQIVGGNLVGVESGTPDTVSVPVSDVQEALVKRKSPRKTAMLVGGLTAFTAITAVLAAQMTSARGCIKPGDASVNPEIGKDHCDPNVPDGQ
jgi:hypothetical protein